MLLRLRLLKIKLIKLIRPPRQQLLLKRLLRLNKRPKKKQRQRPKRSRPRSLKLRRSRQKPKLKLRSKLNKR